MYLSIRIRWFWGDIRFDDVNALTTFCIPSILGFLESVESYHCIPQHHTWGMLGWWQQTEQRTNARLQCIEIHGVGNEIWDDDVNGLVDVTFEFIGHIQALRTISNLGNRCQLVCA